MKRLLGLGLGVLAALLLVPAQASASTLTDCLAAQHVCVARDGRSLVSQSQEAQLARQIGGENIYLVVAAAGPSGYNSAMGRIISALRGRGQFTVGFLDTQQRHFGAYNSGMLPPHGAAEIATSVVQQHEADQNVFAALTDFVTEVKQQAGQGGAGETAGQGAGGETARPASHALRNFLIVIGVIAVIALFGVFVIWRPIRKRRQQELKDAKLAAQDDLIALSNRLTDRNVDVSIQGNPEAAEEQAAALTAYERGTAALDSARSVKDMGAVSRSIAEGQYHLASADALAAGQPRPERRPSCFFDPRHGMSVRDVHWVPPSGGPVSYVNAGFAPAYWGGFGFGPGLFTGFLLGEALAPFPFGGGYYGDGADYGAGDGSGGDGGDGDYGGGDFGGDYGGGDFGGGDFGGGDFGGGDFGGGDFGGGDFG